MNLKIKLIISLNLLIILAACSSTSRYTKSSEESNRTNVSGYLEIQTGIASFYADEFNGKKTASGEIYNMNELTAAHPSYPFNTIVVVTNQKNNKSVRVRINDRMPGFKNRIIDLSLKAAEKIDMIRDGIQEVKVEVLKWGN
ncbi:MAG: septal ring lytic transglycosylase RlpA family protein [Ignavibacteriota bacterium]|nr:septal ring lytic transglycosylase RlpA family protein [Ignavibacteriota bacterium]MCZ2269017.1 septal ring lytic transglycosylase RlpA family protein [Ignavibacteriales bacterium]QKJ98625.1 MAG: septal ring lytic transglycosylase RlpA family protein [Ignavibacteriota bacterium]HMN17309.1 septal ring lytic transglycosylase RlpA family protein [Ignavibacteriaceae bacterium]HOJ07507.1 septal ring lytic transglycosylase RlpA family protein [Ignavibacteriaceae bacterium]